jgi:hypothetical protein
MAFLSQDMTAFRSLGNLSVEIRRNNVGKPVDRAFWFGFLHIKAGGSNLLLAGIIPGSTSHIVTDIQFYLGDVLHVPILEERKGGNCFRNWTSHSQTQFTHAIPLIYLAIDVIRSSQIRKSCRSGKKASRPFSNQLSLEPWLGISSLLGSLTALINIGRRLPNDPAWASNRPPPQARVVLRRPPRGSEPRLRILRTQDRTAGLRATRGSMLQHSPLQASDQAFV